MFYLQLSKKDIPLQREKQITLFDTLKKETAKGCNLLPLENFNNNLIYLQYVRFNYQSSFRRNYKVSFPVSNQIPKTKVQRQKKETKEKTKVETF